MRWELDRKKALYGYLLSIGTSVVLVLIGLVPGQEYASPYGQHVLVLSLLVGIIAGQFGFLVYTQWPVPKPKPAPIVMGSKQFGDFMNKLDWEAKSAPFKEIALDSSLKHVQAHLFWPFYYPFLYFVSRSARYKRDLNNYTRNKLLVNYTTNNAYYLGEYARNLLTPIQRIKYVPEVKWFHVNMEEWCRKRELKLVQKSATSADLIEVLRYD
jgi:hypothetical protein